MLPSGTAKFRSVISSFQSRGVAPIPSIRRLSGVTSNNDKDLGHRSIAVIGGGPVGLATAVHLARQGLGAKVLVLERDASYKRCSALLSAGGIRQQYSLVQNIAMATYSADFLLDYAASQQRQIEATRRDADDDDDDDVIPEIAWKPHGYLFLGSTPEQVTILERNHATQLAHGADWIRMAQADQLAKLYPWLNTEDIIAGSYSSKDTGTKEGYFDPWGYMQCMKQEAQRLGVLFTEGQIDGVTASHAANHTEEEPSLRIESIYIRSGGDGSSSQKNGSASSPTAAKELTRVDTIINCTGAWSRDFVETIICKPLTNTNLLTPQQSATILHRIPIERRKRCIFYMHCPGLQSFSHPVPPTNTPLTIDPSGVYFRAEGNVPGHFLCGVSPDSHLDDNCRDEDLEHVDHYLFDDIIWPTLAHRVPAFNELKVKSSWAGFYDYNTLDQNCILGYHPNLTNVICAGGFSGHGLQMAPAAGRAVTELLQHGAFQTLDLSAFSFDRIVNKEPCWETGIV